MNMNLLRSSEGKTSRPRIENEILGKIVGVKPS
jgi:hypothetical protein